MTQRSEIESARLQEIIARDLPGWKLSEQDHSAGKNNVGARPHIKRVGDLDQLRRKYLAPMETVLVYQQGSASQKTADIINGRAIIVQG